MDHLLYGAAYYDEYMPYERLDQDIAMMKKAGMNVVRIGESTWSTCEPQEGVFDFSHVTKVIEAMGKAGISVIIGTPTYAIPTWMAASYPDVLATTKRGKGIYGPRQIMDITNPVYLFYAERVIRKMMETCAGYENVIGVQLDNETKAYGTAGPNVQRMFVKYLREKFHGDLDAMNHEFGLDYWSNRINAWEDFPDVRGTINASLGAEFARFQRKLCTDFLLWQRDIVKEYLRPDQFITHNTDFNWIGYSYGLNGETDVFDNAKAFTITGTDIYHPTQDHLTGMEIAFGGDVTRSTKEGANYLVLETEAQGFPGWVPYDGQLRLQAYSHLASGADMVEYWHWHTLHNAFETYWRGVLAQDFKENAVYRECCRTGSEWNRIGAHLVNLKKKNRAAILVSNESLTGLDWFPVDAPSGQVHYDDILMKVYRALYYLNIECDILWPQNAAKAKDYDFVVTPALYSASDSLLEILEDYVKGGGYLLSTYKTGFSNEHLKVWDDEFPHRLAKVFGMSYSLLTYPENAGLTGKEGKIEGARVTEFMELLNPEGCEVLASYDHYNWKQYAAITRNRYGNGTAEYIGCGLDDQTLENFIKDAAGQAGVLPEEGETFPLIIRRGTNDFGKEILYLLNYSKDAADITYHGADAKELTGDGTVCDGQVLTVGPWDLLILER